MNRAPSEPSCDYCGLPLGALAPSSATASVPAQSAAASPLYCCYGCRFAASVTAAQGDAGQARWMMTRLGLAIFFSMNVMVFTMFLWSQDQRVTDQAASVFFDVGRYVCLLFSAPVVLLLAGPLAEDAASELRRGRPSLSMLLVAGVVAAFGYSLVSVFRGSGHVYFEVACMVLVAVTLGRWLEATGKLKTTEALRALQKLLPDQVRVLETTAANAVGSQRETLRPLGDVCVGDMVRVLPGERIAVDGVVRRNCAAVDQQTVTGESEPVFKEPGDLVYSGTLNLDGDLWIETTARATSGTLQRLIDAILHATADKAAFQRLADRISAFFLPIITVIAVAAFGVHARWYGVGEGLLAALAVIVIACPCALGLATPMALWAALGKAARHHVLLRHGDALSRLAHATTICFDKTGTLTTGEPALEEIYVAAGERREDVLRIAATVARSSNHPLSQAIAARWTGELPSIHDSRSFAGLGVSAVVDELAETVWLGSERFLQTANAAVATNAAALVGESSATVFVAWGGQVRGAFSFRETLRPAAISAVRQLQNAGLRVMMLTGDRTERAVTLGRELGIEVRGRLLPDEKLAAIRELRGAGPVVMVGDGINDAPSLAAADVGVALGCGTDLSRDSADVCLLSNDLAKLPWLIDLSRATTQTIRWNLLWAFGYNVIGIGIAAAGLLNPIVAAVAMVASSLLVVTNSLRLAQDADRPAPLPSPSRVDEPTANSAIDEYKITGRLPHGSHA